MEKSERKIEREEKGNESEKRISITCPILIDLKICIEI